MGDQADPQQFLTMIGVGVEDGRGAGVLAWTTVEDDNLTMSLELISSSPTGATVVTAGSQDADDYSHTRNGQLVAHAASIGRQATPVAAVPPLPGNRSPLEYELHCRSIVEGAIHRERFLLSVSLLHGRFLGHHAGACRTQVT